MCVCVCVCAACLLELAKLSLSLSSSKHHLFCVCCVHHIARCHTHAHSQIFGSAHETQVSHELMNAKRARVCLSRPFTRLLAFYLLYM